MYKKLEKSDNKFNLVNMEEKHDVDYKMFGLIKVRPIGVTKLNILSMLFLEFVGLLAMQWETVYQIYFFQN